MLTPPLSPPSDRSAYLTGLSIALLGSILFSTKAILAKLIYRYNVDAVTLIAFRMMFSLPFFAAIALWKAKKEPALSRPDLARVIVLGLLGYYLSSFLDFLGLQYISAGLERLILFLTPSCVLLISACFLHKKITRAEWMSLALSYLGVILVFFHDALRGGPDVVLGCLFVLGSTLSYSFYLIFSGQLVRRVGSTRLVGYAMCVSSVACIGQFFLLRPLSYLTQPMPVYGLSLINAIFCTVMPVFLTMSAVSRIGAATASQASMIGPVSMLFMAALILGEPITVIQLAGTALVLAGMYKLSKKNTSPASPDAVPVTDKDAG